MKYIEYYLRYDVLDIWDLINELVREFGFNSDSENVINRRSALVSCVLERSESEEIDCSAFLGTNWINDETAHDVNWMRYKKGEGVWWQAKTPLPRSIMSYPRVSFIISNRSLPHVKIYLKFINGELTRMQTDEEIKKVRKFPFVLLNSGLVWRINNNNYIYYNPDVPTWDNPLIFNLHNKLLYDPYQLPKGRFWTGICDGEGY